MGKYREREAAPTAAAIAAHQLNARKARLFRKKPVITPAARKAQRQLMGHTKAIRKEATELAYRMVTDKAYLRNLAERLKKGRAPHMEPLMWQYAFGRVPERITVDGEVDMKVTRAAEDFKQRIPRLALTLLSRLKTQDTEPDPFALPPGGPKTKE